jgi:hypothetical protein
MRAGVEFGCVKLKPELELEAGGELVFFFRVGTGR